MMLHTVRMLQFTTGTLDASWLSFSYSWQDFPVNNEKHWRYSIVQHGSNYIQQAIITAADVRAQSWDTKADQDQSSPG